MKRAKILVVDDDPDICEIVQTNLEGSGYAVLQARDGAEGLQKARAEHPDLVILDVLMPEMDGWETLRRIQADPQLAELPVMMLSCVAEDAAILRGLEEGAVEYLTKPFYPENLVASVGILLEVFDPTVRDGYRQHLIARRRRLMDADAGALAAGEPAVAGYG